MFVTLLINNLFFIVTSLLLFLTFPGWPELFTDYWFGWVRCISIGSRSYKICGQEKLCTNHCIFFHGLCHMDSWLGWEPWISSVNNEDTTQAWYVWLCVVFVLRKKDCGMFIVWLNYYLVNIRLINGLRSWCL